MNRLNTLAPEDDLIDRPGDFAENAAATRATGGGASRRSRAGDGSRNRINVGQSERTASLVAGAALVGIGLFRGRLSGLVTAGLGAMLAKRGLEGHCPMYEAMGMNSAEGEQNDRHRLYKHGVKIEHSTTIQKPARELYDYWRDLTNLSKFMTNVKRVDVRDEKRSHWVIEGPAGTSVEYDAETINDEPGRLIAWQSVGGADIQHAGSVNFIENAGGRGTTVRLNIEYLPPVGVVGEWGARILRLVGQAPENDVRQSLRNFRALMEAGEIPTNEGCPRGTCGK